MNCKSKTKKMEKHKILFYQYLQKKFDSNGFCDGVN